MLDTILLIAIFVGIIVGVIFILRANKKPESNESDRSFLLLSQRMDSLMQEINNQLERSRQASERSVQNVSSQVQSFTKGMTELRETVHQVEESVKDINFGLWQLLTRTRHVTYAVTAVSGCPSGPPPARTASRTEVLLMLRPLKRVRWSLLALFLAVSAILARERPSVAEQQVTSYKVT